MIPSIATWLLLHGVAVGKWSLLATSPSVMDELQAEELTLPTTGVIYRSLCGKGKHSQQPKKLGSCQSEYQPGPEGRLE